MVKTVKYTTNPHSLMTVGVNQSLPNGGTIR